MFQASEKWKGPAWLLKLNLLSFEMSDCFIFTSIFLFTLQVSYRVLYVAMTHQLLCKSVCSTLSVFHFIWGFGCLVLDLAGFFFFHFQQFTWFHLLLMLSEPTSLSN